MFSYLTRSVRSMTSSTIHSHNVMANLAIYTAVKVNLIGNLVLCVAQNWQKNIGKF